MEEMGRHQKFLKLVEGLIQDNKGSDYEGLFGFGFTKRLEGGFRSHGIHYLFGKAYQINIPMEH